jgi:hypothetical protein
VSSGAGDGLRSGRGLSGFTLRSSRPGPSRGWLRSSSIPRARGVLRLGFAFGSSQRTSIPLVLQPLLTSPRRAAPSRTRPSRPTPRAGRTRRRTPSRPTRTRHLGHPRRSPWVRPATFLAHPPRLRDGPLMTTGFAEPCRLARTAPPFTRSPPHPRQDPTRHVFLGSRFRLRLPSHPASRRRSCPWLVVGVISSTRDSHPRAAGHARRTSKNRARGRGSVRLSRDSVGC